MVAAQASKKPLYLLVNISFLRSLEEQIVYVTVATSESPSSSIEFPPKVHQLLTYFSDIIPKLSNELSPFRDIQHAINLVHGFTLSN